MGCDVNDCFHCPYPDCILDKPKQKPKRNRSEYQHAYYMRRKEGKRIDNVCKYCGKECTGEMYRIDRKNYCSMDCVFCYLYDKADSRIQIISV